MLKKLLARNKVSSVGKAEFKITMITLYYIVHGVIGLVSYGNRNVMDFASYVICESSGNHLDCDDDLTRALDRIGLQTVVMVMISLLPVVVLVFTCDPNLCKKMKGKATNS